MQQLILTVTALFAFCVSGLATIQPQALGPASQQQSKSATELAEVDGLNVTVRRLYGEGKYDEALPLAKRVLDIRLRNLGPDDEHIATSLVYVADIYEAKKKPGDAQEFFERALAFYERKFGANDAKVAAMLDRLGPIYNSGLHYREAEQALQRSLAIKEKLYGLDNPDIAPTLDNLAQFYRYRGDAKKAEALFERALVLTKTSLPPDSPMRQTIGQHYFCTLSEFRRFDKLGELSRKRAEESSPAAAGDNPIGGGVLNGKAVRLIQPEYPVAARNARVEGVIIVAIVIDETGKVIEAHDLCGGNPLLAKPSIAAALKSLFTPTRLSGVAVKVSGMIDYNFVGR